MRHEVEISGQELHVLPVVVDVEKEDSPQRIVSFLKRGDEPVFPRSLTKLAGVLKRALENTKSLTSLIPLRSK